MDIPAFHPEWIVTFWLTTPGLNKMDPHIILILLISILVVYYFKRKSKVKVPVDSGEDQFQLLLMRKKILEKEIVELDKDGNQDNHVIQKRKELEAHLDLTNKKLQEFTI